MLQLNKESYKKLLQENLDWLLKQPRSLERDHIEQMIQYEMQHFTVHAFEADVPYLYTIKDLIEYE